LQNKEKIKELQEMIEVVLIRIPKEIEAMNFYMSAAQKTTSPDAKELFVSLSIQEQGHEAELRRILQQLQDEFKALKQTK
jgi:rubrerythrin